MPTSLTRTAAGAAFAAILAVTGLAATLGHATDHVHHSTGPHARHGAVTASIRSAMTGDDDLCSTPSTRSPMCTGTIGS
jgi:hypothetical protein